MKAIILAGGSGSRLWPLSRDMYPKQLLTIDGDKSLLQQTYYRLLRFIKPNDVITVTNIKYFQDIKMQLDDIAAGSTILTEPMGRNTAPAIACALKYIEYISVGNDDTILILPSDHLIRKESEFIQTAIAAEEIASKGYIATFGIKPVYPEIGYGYIKALPEEKIACGMRVESFVEKPDINTAKKYIASGHYYWNSGMFMGKASLLLSEFELHALDIYSKLDMLNFNKGPHVEYGVYEKMPSISIDYAIMEKSSKVAVVELLSDWNDLGSWQSIYSVSDKDENGNVIVGNVVANNIKNSLVYSQKNLVAVSDLSDVILVETEDAVMACSIKSSQNVKRLYEKLKSTKSGTTLLHKTVFRPWGYYTCLNQGKGYLTRLICILPYHKLSYQTHRHRSEHWVVLEGEALIIMENKQYKINAGYSFDVPAHTKHSLQNPYDYELKIIEVQSGNCISDDDIIRYE